MADTYTPFAGIYGHHNYSDRLKARNYREKMLQLFPNADIPITALSSRAGKGKVLTANRLDWTIRTIPIRAGAVTNVYIDANLATAYVYATHQATFGIKGATVYATVAEDTANRFRKQHHVKLTEVGREVDVTGKVTEIWLNGASSVIAVKLNEADDNDSDPTNHNIATVDKIVGIGNVYPQGSTRTKGVGLIPVNVYNYPHIWRTPLDIDGSTMSTEMIGFDPYKDAKRTALYDHGVDMEMDVIHSVRSEDTAANEKPEYTIMGMREFIKTYLPNNTDNFSLNSLYSGSSWIDAGKTWLDAIMKYIISWGTGQFPTEIMCVLGSGAYLGIHQLAEEFGTYNIDEKTRSFGFVVMSWTTPFGAKVNLRMHGLMHEDNGEDDSMLIYPLNGVHFHPKQGRDTKFKPDILYDKGGSTGYDGKSEEYLTEGTFSYDITGPWGYLKGVGKNNVV